MLLDGREALLPIKRRQLLSQPIAFIRPASASCRHRNGRHRLRSFVKCASAWLAPQWLPAFLHDCSAASLPVHAYMKQAAHITEWTRWGLEMFFATLLPCTASQSLVFLWPAESARSKMVRKQYTISKAREKWTSEEHGRFLEAIARYHRDWRKIVDFIKTRTVAQVCCTTL